MAESKQLEPNTVELLDVESGETLTCLVGAEIELEGSRFVVVTPVDELATLAVIEGEGDEAELRELEPEEFQSAEAAINSVLQQLDIKVVHKSDEYVIKGDLDDDLFEDYDEDEDVLEVETDDGEERRLLIIAEVDTAERIYVVAVDFQKPVYPARMEGDQAIPLNAEELTSMRDIFDEVIAKMREE